MDTKMPERLIMSLGDRVSDGLIGEYSTPESFVDPAWMVGARTRLVDSWSPMPEMIRMPGLKIGAGSVLVRMGEGVTHLGLPTSRLALVKWYAKGRHRAPAIEADVPVLDLRFDGAQNIAHAFCKTGLMALAAKRALRESTGDDALMCVVPGNAKGYVVRALEVMGLTPVPTFGPVRGKIVEVEGRGHNVFVHLRSQLLPPSLGELIEDGPATPERLFISRRDVRRIENEAQIRSLLERRGFTLIYAEDLPVAEQVRYLANATDVVAIHGAALGALACRAALPGRRPLRLLELFGSGYIVTLYREMASDLGDFWMAVRGRVTPEAVRDTDRAGVARAHEKSDFAIDEETFCVALEASERRSDPQYVVTW